MQRTTALGISAAIVVAVIAYVLFRYLNQRGRSKYGFAAREAGDANLSRAERAKRVFESFVAQNDAAIKDVFSDYAAAHPSWESVSYDNGQWTMKPLSGRTGAMEECIVRCYATPSYEDGSLITAVDVVLPPHLNERHVLEKALEKVIRKSKTGGKVVISVRDR